MPLSLPYSTCIWLLYVYFLCVFLSLSLLSLSECLCLSALSQSLFTLSMSLSQTLFISAFTFYYQVDTYIQEENYISYITILTFPRGRLTQKKKLKVQNKLLLASWLLRGSLIQGDSARRIAYKNKPKMSPHEPMSNLIQV